MACTLYDKVIEEANSKVGLQEKPRGSNDGPELRAYLKDTGFEPGQPWCLYFLEAVISKAFAKANHPPANLLKTGGTMALLEWAKSHKKTILGTEGLSTGSIGLVHGGDITHVHHAVIITGEDPNNPNNFLTVEGNTNPQGGFEGYIVAKRSRLKSTIIQVIY